MIDLQTLKDIGSFVTPAVAVGGVFGAFLKFGGNRLVEKIDERAAIRTAPTEKAVADLTKTVEDGFQAVADNFTVVADKQDGTNDHLEKLNSKVATQEEKTGQLSQRAAHLEGRLGLPLGSMPGQTHVEGIAYIDGRNEKTAAEVTPEGAT